MLAVCGSLQARSTNGALLEVAREVAPEGTELFVFDELADVPNFRPDAPQLPAPVERFAALVAAADALLIATPEYAFGVPGSLKNLLDWVVGSGELYGKPVVILSAAPAPERGVHARADLERTLGAQGARVLVSATIAVPAAARGGEARDPAIRGAVSDALAVLAGV